MGKLDTTPKALADVRGAPARGLWPARLVARTLDRHVPTGVDRTWLRKVRVLYTVLIVANVVFAVLRGLAQLTSERPTGYWINLVSAATTLASIVWFERAPARRFRPALHLLLVTLWLLLMAATCYGFTSSPWWLLTLPLAAAAIASTRETAIWGALAMVGMLLGLLVIPHVGPYAALPEPAIESVASRIALIVSVTAVGLGVRRVMERGASELLATQRTLEEANRRLRAVNDAKDVFLANVSHEIRTPLAGVIGTTDLALAESLPAEAREQVRTAHASARAALLIVNDILDISKIESGRLRLEGRVFDLATALEEALAPLFVQARQKGLTTACTADPGVLRHRLGDPSRIAQILNNLVGNAIKFTASGSVSVAVRAAPNAPDRLVLAVSDTGIGIAPDDLARIFDKFVQVDATSTRAFGGTGLGLTIARELARLFDGTIEASSVLGQGSVFTATLVVRCAPGTAETLPARLDVLHAEAPAPPVARPEPAPTSTAREVLLVDDDPVSLMVLRHMLVRLGHRVTLTPDGVAALAAHAAGNFDIVVTDVQMPNMDGVELTRQLRAREAQGGRRLRIIILSAHATHGLAERFLVSGADVYLAKPVAMGELGDALCSTQGTRLAV